MSFRPRVSVVIPTYERLGSLRRLVLQLAEQSFDIGSYELIIVDDGTSEPAERYLADLSGRCDLVFIRRNNGGPAAARDAGARAAKGELLVMLDDDMQVGPRFLQSHVSHHRGESNLVVLGRIRPDPTIREMPIFERFHAAQLDKMAEAFERGLERPRGTHLYTGNVSMSRASYLAAGGFDQSLRRSEDRELGIRLELQGARFVFATGDAESMHSSDHSEPLQWLDRAFSYGVHDLRIKRKHETVPDADPWAFMSIVSPIIRPFYFSSALAPGFGRGMGRLLLGYSMLADKTSHESAALVGTTAAFGMTYFAGVGAKSGSRREVIRDLASHLSWRSFPIAKRWRDMVRADHETLGRYRARYQGEPVSREAIRRDLVEKIGFQILAAVRLMQVLRAAGRLGAAKALSRLIRHLYGSDVHWDARIAPGVLLVHGMGLCIGKAASVGPGCILFQNVTLGEGVHPESRRVGSPRLEEDVHVGPGATILGPVTIGARSKVMAGSLITETVPEGSLVSSPGVTVGPRPTRGPMERRPQPSSFSGA